MRIILNVFSFSQVEDIDPTYAGIKSDSSDPGYAGVGPGTTSNPTAPPRQSHPYAVVNGIGEFSDLDLTCVLCMHQHYSKFLPSHWMKEVSIGQDLKIDKTRKKDFR